MEGSGSPMNTRSLLAILLFTHLAFVSSSHAQATSVKRIARQLPPGSVPQAPPAPTPPAGSVLTPPAAPVKASVAVPPAVPAAPVKPKTDAEKAELLKKTIETEKRRAEAGSDSAQYDVGMRYFRGDGVEKNLEEAEKWLERSAKQGNETAGKRLADAKALLKP